MNQCPIWKTPAVVIEKGSDGMKVDSYRTDGQYRISGTAMAIAANLTSRQKAVLTTWIVDQHRAGEAAPMINSEVLEAAIARRPLTVSERKARFFLLALQRDFQPSSKFKVSGLVDEEFNRDTGALSAWMECQSDIDRAALLRLITEEGLIEQWDSASVRLTSKGFERLEVLETSGADTKQAFVAMWFGADMNHAYTAGIEPAIINAGFLPLRIDRKEHNNKIDDEIIAEIRRSRFVVADFTCGTVSYDGEVTAIPRGGVYYEAGFAQGLGIPVIWCCREDHIGHVHFDTRKFNHITWTDPEDLRVKLNNRIRAVIT